MAALDDAVKVGTSFTFIKGKRFAPICQAIIVKSITVLLECHSGFMFNGSTLQLNRSNNLC